MASKKILKKNLPVPKTGIYWLASYPKSGNTWTRTFIQAMRIYQGVESGRIVLPKPDNTDEFGFTETGLIDINALSTGAIASARGWIEQILGFDISDLNANEVDKLRPDAYRWFAKQMNSFGYHKIHDAYTYLHDGSALIPADATTGSLYLIRNPLDVAISFANHSMCSIDQSINMMGNPDYAFSSSTNQLTSQLRQWLLSWSDHVLSWTNADDINQLVVRYEDMKGKPIETFSAMADFLHFPSDKKAITTVLDQIKIERLQKQEQEQGFNEKATGVKSFFRKGIVGDWHRTLSQSQIDRIIEDHYDVMQKFGYLDEHGNPSKLILPN